VVLTLIGLVVPLGLDTFAVAAALGMAGLPREQRLRVTLLFTGFEMGMPLIGLLAGRVVGTAAGAAADYLAIAILIGLGAYMAWPWRKEEDEEQRVSLLSRTRGLAAIGLGISISTDELAIGFTFGLLRLPVALVITLIGLQTVVATQAGLRLGVRLGEAIREGAERVAGIALLLLGLYLLVQRLRGHG
jgi:putative Mn2+ efflux pump MntP